MDQKALSMALFDAYLAYKLAQLCANEEGFQKFLCCAGTVYLGYGAYLNLQERVKILPA